MYSCVVGDFDEKERVGWGSGVKGGGSFFLRLLGAWLLNKGWCCSETTARAAQPCLCQFFRHLRTAGSRQRCCIRMHVGSTAINVCPVFPLPRIELAPLAEIHLAYIKLHLERRRNLTSPRVLATVTYVANAKKKLPLSLDLA